MVILGANLGYRLYPLQHYECKETNNQKIGLDIVIDYIKVVCKHIRMFVSKTKWQMQSGVKSGANTLYCILCLTFPMPLFHTQMHLIFEVLYLTQFFMDSLKS